MFVFFTYYKDLAANMLNFGDISLKFNENAGFVIYLWVLS